MGYCPYCKHQVAPRTEVCPGCGNTWFQFKTGARTKTVVTTRCTSCWNRGYTDQHENNRCPACNGKAKRDGFWSTWICESCVGSGWISSTKRVTCSQCQGKGTVSVTLEFVQWVDTRICVATWHQKYHGHPDHRGSLNQQEIDGVVETQMPLISDIDPEWAQRVKDAVS
jgi:DnaJ-class molecular chaperone